MTGSEAQIEGKVRQQFVDDTHTVEGGIVYETSSTRQKIIKQLTGQEGFRSGDKTGTLY